MYCDTGKVQYGSSVEAGREVASLNQHDKKHKHSSYKCRVCGKFHTTTVTKHILRTPKKIDKYPIKYTMPVKAEEIQKKKKKKWWKRNKKIK